MESKINKAVYGLADRSIFGVKIISGIVTGVSCSEDYLPKNENFAKKIIKTEEKIRIKDKINFVN